MNSTFKTNALRGFKWSFLNKIAAQALHFIFSVILARLLSPDDFGMFAMITVFSNLGLLFKDFGFGHALIYDKDPSKNEFDSVFVLNLITGIFLTTLFFFLAPVIAGFYNEPRLTNLTKVFSVVFFIQSFGLVNLVELKKRIDFKRLAVIENTSLLISSLIAIALAYYGFGVWSLVARTIMNMTLRTIIVFFVSSYRPGLNLNIKVIKKLWRYSINVSANGFLTYWMRNLDNLMIGKMIGQQSLGIYNMAYQIMLFPIRNISNTIKDVLFPSFSSIKNDINVIRSVYLKVIQTIALITFPMLAGIAILSEPFVLIVLGDKWEPMIPILSLLALVAIPQSIFTVNGTIYLNTGRPDIPLKINLISLPLYAIGFYVGLKLNGVIGMVYAYITIYTLLIFPIYYFSASQMNLKILVFLKKIYPIILSTTLMSSVILVVNFFSLINEKNILSFLLIISLGILTYFSMLYVLRDKIDLFALISKQK
ncbi:MAG: MOP flippase family protein [Bacteroidota bacterium]